MRSWITPRWNFISKTHTQYEEIINLFAEDDLKALYSNSRENGAYVDIDSFLRKEEDISDEIKQTLLSLKNTHLNFIKMDWDIIIFCLFPLF